ncbi:MAG: hypothetical protein Ta2E_00260 [Mycoplasmoidaceae bacterium]|nr:MAG: hypothetical protein Ta2E_00260 [Mycoplasmoidaceae bacterium]
MIFWYNMMRYVVAIIWFDLRLISQPKISKRTSISFTSFIRKQIDIIQ